MAAGKLVGGALAVTLTLAPGVAGADGLGYAGIVDLRAEGADFVVLHHHDWSPATEPSRWKMISTHRDPFQDGNQFAFLAWYGRDGRTLMRKVPSPALTWLGVSADSRYVIGLSDVKLWNPFQLVVWSRDGALLLRRHIDPEVSCLTPARYRALLQRFPRALESLAEFTWAAKGVVYVDFLGTRSPKELSGLWDELLRSRCPSPFSPNFSGSVTNWIRWFDRENPSPQVIEVDGAPAFLRLRDPKGKSFDIPFRLERPSASGPPR